MMESRNNDAPRAAGCYGFPSCVASSTDTIGKVVTTITVNLTHLRRIGNRAVMGRSAQLVE